MRNMYTGVACGELLRAELVHIRLAEGSGGSDHDGYSLDYIGPIGGDDSIVNGSIGRQNFTGFLAYAENMCQLIFWVFIL